jgi:ATP-dependent protease ClpP protease subunit
MAALAHGATSTLSVRNGVIAVVARRTLMLVSPGRGFMTAKEAVVYGIIDRVLTRRFT